MVEKPVILIIIEDERGLRPDSRISGKRSDEATDHHFAEWNGRIGMLAHLHHGHDPRHLRKAIGGHIFGERGNQVAGLRLFGIFGAFSVDPIDIGATTLVAR